MYFARIPVVTKWPPVGDAIFHSQITSLLVYNGHTGLNMLPLDNFPHPYPTGFHVFSADLSLLVQINPAESVYVLATYLVILVSALLFTLTYELTRSYVLSSPIPFTILIAHSSGHLGRWIGGFIYNGPYPNLFGFVGVLVILIILQMTYARERKLLNSSTIVLLILLSLLVTYPSFIFHSTILITIYFIFSWLRSRKIKVKTFYENQRVNDESILNKNYLHLILADLKSTISRLGKPSVVLSSARNNLRSPLYREKQSYYTLRINAVIFFLFILIFLTSGLVQFYRNMITYFPSEFQKHSSSPWLDRQIVWENFNTDLLFKALPAITIAFSLALLLLKSEINPLFVGWLIILSSIVFVGANFIVPQRTLAFLAGLSWPLLAYILYKFIYHRYEKRPLVMNLVFLGFVAVAVIFIVPNMENDIYAYPGWYLSRTLPSHFKDSYDAGVWLKHNAKPSDLILNDRSYASFYLQGFSLLNLTHNYFNGYSKPQVDNPTAKDILPRELNQVWLQPGNVELVHSLLNKYDVKYIVIMEGLFGDFSNWGGSGDTQAQKDNALYIRTFGSYDFLNLSFHEGGTYIYTVNKVGKARAVG